MKRAAELVRAGKGDEEIERRTGLGLLAILALRARAATPQLSPA